jgi:hypothetical protein
MPDSDILKHTLPQRSLPNITYVVLVAVNCSYCTPDDGYGNYPKHVEWSCNKIQILVSRTCWKVREVRLIGDHIWIHLVFFLSYPIVRWLVVIGEGVSYERSFIVYSGVDSESHWVVALVGHLLRDCRSRKTSWVIVVQAGLSSSTDEDGYSYEVKSMSDLRRRLWVLQVWRPVGR